MIPGHPSSTYLLHINLNLHLLLWLLLGLLCSTFRLELDALLDGKLGRLTDAPIPGREILPQFADTGEPLLGGIDQLEAELLHQQVTSTIGQLRCRRPQEFISTEKEEEEG